MKVEAFPDNASSNEAKNTVTAVSSENSPRHAVGTTLRLLKGEPVISVNTDLSVLVVNWDSNTPCYVYNSLVHENCVYWRFIFIVLMVAI